MPGNLSPYSHSKQDSVQSYAWALAFLLVVMKTRDFLLAGRKKLSRGQLQLIPLNVFLEPSTY